MNLYGDEFLDNAKKVSSYDKTNVPSSNRDRCNPLFRVHKSEWVSDKIDRKTKELRDKQDNEQTNRMPIHEMEANIAIIKQLQFLHDIRTIREVRVEHGK